MTEFSDVGEEESFFAHGRALCKECKKEAKKEAAKGIYEAAGGGVGGLVAIVAIVVLIKILRKMSKKMKAEAASKKAAARASKAAAAASNASEASLAHTVQLNREATAQREAHLVEREWAATEASTGTPVSTVTIEIKLEEYGLTQYADALEEQGYDSMPTFEGMTNEEAGALADELKMKPGHKRLFIKAFAHCT